MATLGYRQAGDIELGTLTLISRGGQIFDITELMLETNIYQNLYDASMHCEIVVSDATGIIDFIQPAGKDEPGGLSGSEIVLLSYRTPSEEVKVQKHIFILNAVSDRRRVDEKIEAFVLECVSLETFANIDKKISRAYGGAGGNTIENMVRSVHKEFYQSEAITASYRDIGGTNFRVNKTLTVDSTKGKHTYVVPNLDVENTLKFFASEATGENIASSYCFFENSNGFNFRNHVELIDQDPKFTYQYEPSNYHEGGNKADDPYNDSFKIITFDAIREADMLDNMASGLYGSEQILVDPILKKSVKTKFSYEKQQSKFKKLGATYIPGNSATSAVIDMKTTRFQHDQKAAFADEGVRPKSMERTGPVKRAFMKQITNKRMEVTLHGNSDLNVGDVVFLSFPVASTTEAAQREDKYMTGKHLVTSLRHKFDSKTFVTVIECIKDTGFKK